MIKAIIVDDEPLAVKLLSSYGEKLEKLNVLETFTNPMEALQFMQSNDVDLAFLDIQMPELTGIQLAKVINPKTSIIFTTAYPQYAVEGFKLKAIDYLMKPIELTRFLESVNRVETIMHADKYETVESKSTYLFVKTEYRHQKINYNDILYLEGMGDYVAIITTDKKILTLEKLKMFSEKLPNDQFMRVHKSYIIPFDKINYIEKNRISIQEKLIPIGNTFQKAFWEKINDEK